MEDKSLKDKAIDFKGKKYVLISDRVNYFNDNYPDGEIKTELLSDANSDRVIVKATIIFKEGRTFTGMSQAKWSDTASFVNKTSALENAETSAVGRALAFMGIGVIDSIASIDEINKASLGNQNTPKTDVTPENDVMAAYKAKQTSCPKCGAEMVHNPRTGNYFCKDKCWLKTDKE